MADWFGRYTSQTAERLRAGQADGSVRRDVDAFAEARWLVDAGIGMAFRWLVGGGIVKIDREFADLKARLVEHLAPPGSGGAS